MKSKILAFSALMIAVVLTSCSSDDDKGIILKTKSPIVLNSKQTATIEATSTKSISYKSKNEFHATVTNSGLVTAMFVGETEILLSSGSDTKLIKVEVAPKVNLYETPSIEWGASKSQIIAKYGEPNTENATGIGYNNYSPSSLIALFLF